MRKRLEPPSAADIRTLETMLDYAILEGAALRLPMFVLLLRAARLELTSRAGAGPVAPGREADREARDGLIPPTEHR
jgi:hypothetical protein